MCSTPGQSGLSPGADTRQRKKSRPSRSGGSGEGPMELDPAAAEKHRSGLRFVECRCGDRPGTALEASNEAVTHPLRGESHHAPRNARGRVQANSSNPSRRNLPTPPRSAAIHPPQPKLLKRASAASPRCARWSADSTDRRPSTETCTDRAKAQTRVARVLPGSQSEPPLTNPRECPPSLIRCPRNQTWCEQQEPPRTARTLPRRRPRLPTLGPLVGADDVSAQAESPKGRRP